MPSVLKRHWFLFAMAPVVLAGGLLPQGGPFMRQHLTLPLVAMVLVISGFTLDTRATIRKVMKTRAIVLSILSTFVVAPVAAYGLARLWGPPLDGDESTGFLFLQAMMITAAQASTLATAVVMSRIARGDQELALVLSLVSNALTVFLTPFVLRVSIGSRVSFPVGDMMARLGMVIILPLLIGQLIRLTIWRNPGRALRTIQIFPRCIILSFMYIASSSAAVQLRQDVPLALQFLGACTCLHGFMLAWTALSSRLARVPARQRPSVIFSGSQKTVPNGIYVWTTFFATNPYGAVPLVLHQIIQLVAGNLLAARLARLGDARPTSSPPTPPR